ncbi:hypothetical protein F2Q68_00032368 [Brassica cretica]|uniref:Longin domain-containing protein n=1 Tax=Brassica cretica TaxID=69181 RepID=A0A8S9GGQ1_BRACR|nr:hypothetical protein F2Q68_00032368 [Brassica cretica]
MMKMTLIARIADGLPLAEGLHDGHDLQDNEVYKEQGMSLIKKLPRGGNEASYITRGRVCCLTMCDHCYPEELAFKYLEDLKSEFDRVDGLNIETATRPYEFGTFMHKNGKLYQKEASSLRDLCLKSLTGSLTYVNSMPEDLLKRFLGLCTSEELLRIDINNDIYKLTDPVWKRFYQHEFGSKETELVHQNLGMCDTSFKWSECFHEKLCSEGVYNKYPFAPMARKVLGWSGLLDWRSSLVITLWIAWIASLGSKLFSVTGLVSSFSLGGIFRSSFDEVSKWGSCAVPWYASYGFSGLLGKGLWSLCSIATVLEQSIANRVCVSSLVARVDGLFSGGFSCLKKWRLAFFTSFVS